MPSYYYVRRVFLLFRSKDFFAILKQMNKMEVFVLLPKAQEILQSKFGYNQFRQGQEAIIQKIMDGKDTLGIMPTGGGKSVCYQIPAMLMRGVTIVVSPLISLMKDQVDALEKTGIPSTYINSAISNEE